MNIYVYKYKNIALQNAQRLKKLINLLFILKYAPSNNKTDTFNHVHKKILINIKCFMVSDVKKSRMYAL